MQQTGSQFFGVSGPHNIGTGSPVSVVQPTGSLGTGFGSQVTGSPYRASRSQELVLQFLVHRLLGFLPLVVHQMRTYQCGSNLQGRRSLSGFGTP